MFQDGVCVCVHGLPCLAKRQADCPGPILVYMSGLILSTTYSILMDDASGSCSCRELDKTEKNVLAVPASASAYVPRIGNYRCSVVHSWSLLCDRISIAQWNIQQIELFTILQDAHLRTSRLKFAVSSGCVYRWDMPVKYCLR